MYIHGKACKYILEKNDMELKSLCPALPVQKLILGFAKLLPQKLPYYFGIQTHTESLLK